MTRITIQNDNKNKQSKQDELRVRDQLQELQVEMLDLQKVSEKYQILQKVEREVLMLQNEYNHKLGKLQREEEVILERLQHTKTSKDRNQRVRYSQRSYRHWAGAKIDFTLNMTQKHSDFLQKKINQQSANSDDKKQLENNSQFSDGLKTFLSSLKSLTDHQQLIAREYENSIKNMESDILEIRHQMGKVRQNTFAKIHELHKNVEIAHNFELGHRRLSVANGTEIDRERRHHDLKIQRQILTLQSQLGEVDMNSYVGRLGEIVDLEKVMSRSKLKAFFSVFVQSFCQILIDIDLAECEMDGNSLSKDPQINQALNNCYGIGGVLSTIDSQVSPTLNAKIKKIGRFIKTLQHAISCDPLTKQSQKEKAHTNASQSQSPTTNVDIEHVIFIGSFVGRKLSCHQQTQHELLSMDVSQVTAIAEVKCQDIFRAVIDDVKIFADLPYSVAEVGWKCHIVKCLEDRSHNGRTVMIL
ncbi:hypothetical protein RFI_18606 [Reticulomyxa filosa]|uniref:Uncharacterized protein n=1 Tax=Reticulomyxa filosa TaxID=46433 RepID=X6MXA2_RETFI|nr:hypothetical protein RFI_18606 [Reticulomyxa filosa]|eukprot:ETO18655.1 hypothetical protein RFI_18606 [Reticulomyxa filosa]